MLSQKRENVLTFQCLVYYERTIQNAELSIEATNKRISNSTFCCLIAIIRMIYLSLLSIHKDLYSIKLMTFFPILIYPYEMNNHTFCLSFINLDIFIEVLLYYL